MAMDFELEYIDHSLETSRESENKMAKSKVSKDSTQTATDFVNR